MKIVDIDDYVNGDALRVLEEVREEIESGEITAIAVTYISKGGCIGHDTSFFDNNFLMWAALQYHAREFYKAEVGDD